jgi:hypothetical protein
VLQGEIMYTGEAPTLLTGGVKINQMPEKPTKTKNGDLTQLDIAQSHFFTVQIYSPGSGLIDRKGAPFSFASGEGQYKNYIPIKSMNLTYTSYDNMLIPLSIFGDFPIPHRKKLTTISLSCYDLDNDCIEQAVRAWEMRCFPQGKYVEYLDKIKATFTYTSYKVTGEVSFIKSYEVIPANSVTVSRSYEENNAKMVNFSLVAVGEPGASVAGLRLKERGYGDGGETADMTYQLQVSAVANPTAGYNATTASDIDYN